MYYLQWVAFSCLCGSESRLSQTFQNFQKRKDKKTHILYIRFIIPHPISFTAFLPHQPKKTQKKQKHNKNTRNRPQPPQTPQPPSCLDPHRAPCRPSPGMSRQGRANTADPRVAEATPVLSGRRRLAALSSVRGKLNSGRFKGAQHCFILSRQSPLWEFYTLLHDPGSGSK